MRRVSLFLAFALFGLSSGCVSTVEYEVHHANGAVKSKGTMVGEFQEGLWTYYYDTGELKQKGAFTRDVKVGPWTWWYPNGNKESEGTFEHEYNTGRWTYWWPDGKLRARGYFDVGRKNGLWTFFHESGSVERQGEYSNGKRTLRWVFAHEDGSEKADGWFYEGRKIGRWQYRDVSGKATVGDYAMPDGLARVDERWPNGKVRRTGFVRRGVLIGRCVTSHDIGGRRVAGVFVDGEPTGRWRAFKPGGDLLGCGSVARGRPTADWGFASDVGMRPPPATGGAWSKASEYRADDPLVSIGRWLQEAATARQVIAPEKPSENVQVADAVIERQTVVERHEPASEQGPSLTVRELRRMQDWVVRYTEGPKVDSDAYGRVEPGLVGDRARARRLIGKTLPMTKFTAGDGRTVTLKSSATGRWRLCVVLRGFLGQVCPYCPPHIKSLESIEADLVKLETDLLVVYPGRKRGMERFLTAYGKLGERMIPQYKLLYDLDSRLVHHLDIMEDDPSALARSTTLVLDENNKIRFAYVAKNRADRPAARELVKKIRVLRKR